MYDAFNARTAEVLDEVFDPHFVATDPAPGQLPGVEGIKQAWGLIYKVFPNAQIVIEDMLAEGDRVAVRISFQGVHSLDKPNSTGTGMEFVRISDGRIVELWSVLKFS